MIKKLFLSVILTVTVTSSIYGQVGINNDTPAVTLDVVGKPATATVADGILVPRLTAAQLNAKNAIYLTAHRGTMVFVTSGTGTAGTKTANIDGTGFYYYDDLAESGTGRWIKVGGGGSATPTGMTVRTTSSATLTDADLNNVVIITANVTFDLSTLTKTNGKTITFIDNNNAGSSFSVVGAAANAYTTSQGVGTALSYVCDGTSWYSYNAF